MLFAIFIFANSILPFCVWEINKQCCLIEKTSISAILRDTASTYSRVLLSGNKFALTKHSTDFSIISFLFRHTSPPISESCLSLALLSVISR